MATRIETLEGSRRAPKAVWIMLLAVVLVAAALAIGTLVGSDGGTTAPAGSAIKDTPTAVEPATQVPGLVKAGLQPRPFSEIPTADTVEKTPVGFVRQQGSEIRPKFGN